MVVFVYLESADVAQILLALTAKIEYVTAHVYMVESALMKANVCVLPTTLVCIVRMLSVILHANTAVSASSQGFVAVHQDFMDLLALQLALEGALMEDSVWHQMSVPVPLDFMEKGVKKFTASPDVKMAGSASHQISVSVHKDTLETDVKKKTINSTSLPPLFLRTAKCNVQCMNGGTCLPPNQCKCPPLFFGKLCQKEICRMTCLNGGRCSNNKCLCPAGFEGKHCERRLCLFEHIQIPHRRIYRKVVHEQYPVPCGVSSYYTCIKTRLKYVLIQKDIYKTVYRCT